jgi:hypothetical protein
MVFRKNAVHLRSFLAMLRLSISQKEWRPFGGIALALQPTDIWRVASVESAPALCEKLLQTMESMLASTVCQRANKKATLLSENFLEICVARNRLKTDRRLIDRLSGHDRERINLHTRG